MRNRPRPPSTDEALDIFDDERFSTALAAATQPNAPVAADPQQPPPVVSSPAASPEKRGASEPRTAPKTHPTTARGTRKSRASGPTALETRALPEPNVPLKFRVPEPLRSEFHRFKAELAAALGGIALDDSNIARPLVEIFLVELSERVLEEATAYRGQLKRPPNGDAVGMAEFDHSIGEIFRKARKRRSPTSSGSAAP